MRTFLVIISIILSLMSIGWVVKFVFINAFCVAFCLIALIVIAATVIDTLYYHDK